jgi:AbrB family looped-hinge helix DNA binding protein
MKPLKLTSKNQTTIPKEIRQQLGIKAGDAIIFQIKKDGTIILKKAKPFDKDYLEALEHTLSEWNSKEDDDAFSDLQNI